MVDDAKPRDRADEVAQQLVVAITGSSFANAVKWGQWVELPAKKFAEMMANAIRAGREDALEAAITALGDGCCGSCENGPDCPSIESRRNGIRALKWTGAAT